MTTLANHIYAKMNAADEALALVDQTNQLSAKAQDQARIALNELREAMDLAYTSKGKASEGDNSIQDQAIERMKAVMNFDPEAAHEEADKVLTDVLRGLGFGDLVSHFEDVPKWYA